MEHLESFAKDGLRTLCLGYRILTNEEYNVNKNKIYNYEKKFCLFIIRIGSFNIVKHQRQLIIEMN